MKGRGRAAAAVALLVAGSGAGGCTVGSGAGSAKGSVYVLGCTPDGDFQSSMFDLQPSFFAGEPIEDISQGGHINRLFIRMQRSGNRIEVNDTLAFDVVNSYEVARCVRGRTVNGQPDWDTRTVTAPDGTPTGQVWCDWGAVGDGGVVDPDGGAAGADGGDAGLVAADAATPLVMTATSPRIHLGPLEFLTSSLSLLFTCNKARLVGDAIDGYVQFADFGSAGQPDVPPDMRAPVDQDFKVNFGERLRATFHVVIEDETVVGAIVDRIPVPAPRMGGVLDGYFDFDLDRGRAAQPFP